MNQTVATKKFENTTIDLHDLNFGWKQIDQIIAKFYTAVSA